MELNLTKSNMDCYNLDFKTTTRQEESTETIVPDNCADISRIVNVSGVTFIRNKDIQNGKVNINGSVKAKVVLIPEGEEAVTTCLDATIPFTAVVENPGIFMESSIVVKCAVEAMEATMANPRKVSVKATVTMSVEVYNKTMCTLCTGVEDAEAYGIQSRLNGYSINVPIAVKEKSFVLSDDLEISSGNPPVNEIYKTNVGLIVSESKLIGNKVVFKGIADIRVLYAAGDGMLNSAVFQIPFSQLMELENAQEEDQCAVTLTLTGCEIEPENELSDESNSLTMTLNIVAQAVAVRGQTIELVSDLYSTSYDAVTESSSYEFNCLLDTHTVHENHREVVVPGEQAAAVIDTSIWLSSVEVSQQESMAELTAAGAAYILYANQDNELFGILKSFTVKCRTELADNSKCYAAAQLAGDVSASCAGGDIELRFGVDFTVDSYAKCVANGVSAVTLDMEPKEAVNSPSVVLRVVEGSEALWDIARSYNTSVKEIMKVNAIDSETDLVRGSVLLIPRLR